MSPYALEIVRTMLATAVATREWHHVERALAKLREMHPAYGWCHPCGGAPCVLGCNYGAPGGGRCGRVEP